MKNDTGTAIAEAESTEEAALTPSIVDVAKKDELVDLGYRGDHLQSGWVASEMLGDDRVGPFPTLNELVVAVRERVHEKGVRPADEFEPVDIDDLDRIDAIIGEPDGAFEAQADPDEDEEDLDDVTDADDDEISTVEESHGRPALPGMGHKNNPELTAAALHYHSIKLERCRLSAEEKSAKDDLRIAAVRHSAAFFPDPDNTNSLIYIAGRTADGKNIVVRDQKVETETITTEEIASPD